MRYTILLRPASLDWNSLVVAKKTSVASTYKNFPLMYKLSSSTCPGLELNAHTNVLRKLHYIKCGYMYSQIPYVLVVFETCIRSTLWTLS
jgi:hypothetical protein